MADMQEDQLQVEDERLQEELAAKEELEVFQAFSDQFDKLCQDRHLAGQKEYGTFTFLGNDVVRMMQEELADAANYMRYQYIKLMVLQEMLEGEMREGKLPTEVSFQGFKGTGEVGWVKP